jgi:MAE_28990/MAE_18760-like HEPN
MKINSKIKLQEILNGDLAWRKRELTSALGNINTSSAKTLQFSIRIAILLLYAHWEGFIKNAAESYINYVKYQRLKFNELEDCFLAIALKQKLEQFYQTNKNTLHSEFIRFIRNELHENAVIRESSAVFTMSNLNSNILRQILSAIGLDYSPFELKEKLINNQLLYYRNTIAHGEYLSLDIDEYKLIHHEVIKMIDAIKTGIENAVLLENYKIIKQN